MIYGVGGAVVVGGIVIGGALAGVGGAFVWQGFNFYNIFANARTLAKLRTDDGRVIKLNNTDLLGTRLRPGEDGHGFSLEVRKGKKKERFEGAEAERFLGQIIPKMNRMGGEKRTVQAAVSVIEHHGHPDEFLSYVVTGDRFQDKKGVPGYVNKMAKPTKLALEMALHEEQERRALEGELWRLERAWEEAEEIAAIADNLLIPTETGDFIEKHREDGAAEERPEA